MKRMKLSLIIACLIVFGCWHGVASALATENGTIVERTTYRFPSYEEAVQNTDVEIYADKVAYEQAVADTQFEFQKLKYMSDDLKVVAYLYKPKQVGNRRFPAIIFNRGSAVRGDIAPELLVFFHRLAAEGFVILAPMLRQSDGGEGRDEVGGADVDDLMNIISVAKSLGFVDMNNLFMYGESRGGMMTYQAIKRGCPIQAAAVFGAFTDLQVLINDNPKQYSLTMLKQIWQDYEEHKTEIYKARSAIYWAEKLTVPLLIMHGGADKGVNPSHSLTLAQQLQKLDRVYELVIYAGDGHILSANQVDRDRRAVNWFKSYIKK